MNGIMNDSETLLMKGIQEQMRHRDPIPNVPYQSIEDYVLANGEFFPLATRSAEWKRAVARTCFATSQKLALKSGLTYCEGYALALGVPFLHGWCLDNQGRAIDVTWEEAGDAYFGVKFDLEQVRRHRGKKRWAGSLLDVPPAFPRIYENRFQTCSQRSRASASPIWSGGS